MKSLRLVVLSLVAMSAICACSVVAAPVDSVESSRATAALQKVDAFLGEAAVVRQLQAQGVTVDQARARLTSLSDAQLEQLAAQVELIQAGGTVQGDNPHPYGWLGCIFKQLGRFFYNLTQGLFCWGKSDVN